MSSHDRVAPSGMTDEVTSTAGVLRVLQVAGQENSTCEVT
jgi:hypothetical protein